MSDKIRISAKNVKQALIIAKERFKTDENSIVIKEVFVGVKNLFGIYKKLPEYEAFLKDDEIANKDSLKREEYIKFSKETLEEILNLFDIFNFQSEFKFELDVLHVKLKGSDLKFLVEDGAKVLNALQYIVVLKVNNHFKSHIKIVLDCENFREKRNEFLKDLALKFSKKVIQQQKSVTLEPMNPFERRLIHSYISELQGVYSKSFGKEPSRCVVIYPKQ